MESTGRVENAISFKKADSNVHSIDGSDGIDFVQSGQAAFKVAKLPLNNHLAATFKPGAQQHLAQVNCNKPLPTGPTGASKAAELPSNPTTDCLESSPADGEQDDVFAFQLNTTPFGHDDREAESPPAAQAMDDGQAIAFKSRKTANGDTTVTVAPVIKRLSDPVVAVDCDEISANATQQRMIDTPTTAVVKQKATQFPVQFQMLVASPQDLEQLLLALRSSQLLAVSQVQDVARRCNVDAANARLRRQNAYLQHENGAQRNVNAENGRLQCENGALRNEIARRDYDMEPMMDEIARLKRQNRKLKRDQNKRYYKRSTDRAIRERDRNYRSFQHTLQLFEEEEEVHRQHEEVGRATAESLYAYECNAHRRTMEHLDIANQYQYRPLCRYHMNGIAHLAQLIALFLVPKDKLVPLPPS